MTVADSRRQSGGPPPVILAFATAPERRAFRASGIETADPDGPRPILLQTGVGQPSAQVLADHCARLNPCGLVSIGTAGALESTITAGDLLAPARVMNPDGAWLSVNEPWHRRVCDALKSPLQVHTGDLLWRPDIVREPEEKSALHSETGAIGVDMESGAWAIVARDAGIPFLVLRVVLDTAADSVPAAVIDAANRAGDIRLRSLLTGVMRRPADLPGLIRMALRFRTAATGLRLAGRQAARPLLNGSPDRLL